MRLPVRAIAPNSGGADISAVGGSWRNGHAERDGRQVGELISIENTMELN
jgi:hypothetical protein